MTAPVLPRRSGVAHPTGYGRDGTDGRHTEDHLVRVTVTLPSDLAKAIREEAGPRGVSRFLAEAARQQLQYRNLGRFLGELDERDGPLTEVDQSIADALWPDAPGA
ncbi:CopG family transcriptional regulator [Frankia sp. Cas3]|uniref:ribbon-helix-helix domain-containing protein n=1 Tax=Frankia sp. Cas3 TaxID=3073926 RepID=UPI002AD3707F|nr:CopG family transcriptional regulator [Frankia sp. Cas3]